MIESELKELWQENWPNFYPRAALIVATKTEGSDVEIYDSDEMGIVIELGENLTGAWQSGELIAFWPSGDHTCLEDLEFDVLVENLFQADLPNNDSPPKP